MMKKECKGEEIGSEEDTAGNGIAAAKCGPTTLISELVKWDPLSLMYRSVSFGATMIILIHLFHS
jgi:hypothetical protein